jgi:hypothetical protein
VNFIIDRYIPHPGACSEGELTVKNMSTAERWLLLDLFLGDVEAPFVTEEAAEVLRFSAMASKIRLTRPGCTESQGLIIADDVSCAMFHASTRSVKLPRTKLGLAHIL